MSLSLFVFNFYQKLQSKIMETFLFHLIHIVGQNSGKIWWINSFIFSINSSRRYCCTWSLYDHDVRFTKFLPWIFSIHRLFGCRSLRSTIFGLPTVSVTSEGSCCYLNTVYFLKIKNISSDNVLYRCLKSLWGFWLFPQNVLFLDLRYKGYFSQHWMLIAAPWLKQ